jgi:hypothetical protein
MRIKQKLKITCLSRPIDGKSRANKIPEPRPLAQRLLDAVSVQLPDVLLCRGNRVAARKRRPENHLSH